MLVFWTSPKKKNGVKNFALLDFWTSPKKTALKNFVSLKIGNFQRLKKFAQKFLNRNRGEFREISPKFKSLTFSRLQDFLGLRQLPC